MAAPNCHQYHNANSLFPVLNHMDLDHAYVLTNLVNNLELIRSSSTAVKTQTLISIIPIFSARICNYVVCALQRSRKQTENGSWEEQHHRFGQQLAGGTKVRPGSHQATEPDGLLVLADHPRGLIPVPAAQKRHPQQRVVRVRALGPWL